MAEHLLLNITRTTELINTCAILSLSDRVSRV